MPGARDYTPAWRVRRASWQGEPRELGSVAEVTDAAAVGELTVEETGVVLNAPIVKWSSGEPGVDGDLEEYLGGGQLVEPPDTDAMTARFKLHECFPRRGTSSPATRWRRRPR